MDQKIKQLMALLGDLHGYADALEKECGEIVSRASKLKPASEKLAEVEKCTAELQAKYDALKSQYRDLQSAFDALRAKYQ